MRGQPNLALLFGPGVIASAALIAFGVVLASNPEYLFRAWLFVAIMLGLVWWDIGFHARTLLRRGNAPDRGHGPPGPS